MTSPDSWPPLMLLLVALAPLGFATNPRGSAGSEEDGYLGSRLAACNSSLSSRGSRTLACLEASGLSWLRRAASSPLDLDLGPARLVPLRGSDERTEGTTSPPADEGALGFVLRQLRRFAAGHAVEVPAELAGLVDDREETSTLNGTTSPGGDEGEAESRSKYKKKKHHHDVLVPLLFAYKTKVVLVAIFLSVLVIKKLLIVGAFMLYGMWGMFKHYPATPSHDAFVQPYHHPPGHGWEPPLPHGDEHHGNFDDRYSQHGGQPFHGPNRQWTRHSSAYKAHGPAVVGGSAGM